MLDSYRSAGQAVPRKSAQLQYEARSFPDIVQNYAQVLHLDQKDEVLLINQLGSAFAAFSCAKPNVMLIVSSDEGAALQMIRSLAQVRYSLLLF